MPLFARSGLTPQNAIRIILQDFIEPSTKDFMINYGVEDQEALVEALRTNGVTIVDTIERVDYGKFIHILDLEGNKVELWEPKD